MHMRIMHMQGSHGKCTASRRNTHKPCSPLDKLGSLGSIFFPLQNIQRNARSSCQDDIQGEVKFLQVVAEDVVLTWDDEKQQRSLEELARTANSGFSATFYSQINSKPVI